MKLLHLILFAVSTTLCLAGEAKPNLSDPVTLKRILEKARDLDELQRRGEKLDTGWVKGMYENGQKQKEANLKDGRLEGPYTHWFKNGQMMSKTNHVDGKEHGLQTYWYENGQKQSEINKKDHKLHGLCMWWHENGTNRRETNYHEGAKHGLETVWDKEGNVIRQYRFEKDKKVETLK